jgi:hypothetical protein
LIYRAKDLHKVSREEPPEKTKQWASSEESPPTPGYFIIVCGNFFFARATSSFHFFAALGSFHSLSVSFRSVNQALGKFASSTLAFLRIENQPVALK